VRPVAGTVRGVPQERLEGRNEAFRCLGRATISRRWPMPLRATGRIGRALPAIVLQSAGSQAPGCVAEPFAEQSRASMEVFPGISMDPDVRFGKPCITGTRIDVATIVGALAAGESMATVAEEYALTLEQVRSALGYAAHIAAHLPPAVRIAS
jgi:uncharacterized protein (DUF433 family)